MIAFELSSNSRGSEVVVVFIDGVVCGNLVLVCIEVSETRTLNSLNGMNELQSIVLCI